MKQYKVFKHPVGKIQAVKQGWCWPAFFFSFIWAILGRMWGLGIAVFVILVLVATSLYTYQTQNADGIVNFISFITNVIFGINGNAWREKNLLSRGFDLIDTVTASNKDGAIALAIKNIGK